MLRRLLIVDLLLVIVLIAGGLKLRRSWLEFEATHRVEAIQPEPEPAHALPASTAAALAVEDWTDIVRKNPFSFDRNDIAIVAPPPPPLVTVEGPRAGPKPFLFGTFGLGKTWQATLASGQGGNRKSKVMSVGETIDGWQLLEIHERSVIVAAGATRETILMDAAAQVPRDSTRTLGAEETTVIQQNSQPVVAAASQPPAANPKPAQPAETSKGQCRDTPFGRVCPDNPPQ